MLDERAVQLNIISKEQLLWCSSSRQGGERQCHIAPEKLHIHTYTCAIIAVIFPCFVFLFSELENLYYSFQCILIAELSFSTLSPLTTACFHHSLHNEETTVTTLK